MRVAPVLVYPQRQADKARRLAEYCRNLDGTSIVLVEAVDGPCANPANVHGCRAAESLRLGAKSAGAAAMLWMECDSIPRRKGWLKALTDEYIKGGKPFMLSSDKQRFDLVGGIGVYDCAKTLELIPTCYESNSWDLWMIQNIPELIHKTDKIQHSYAVYDRNGRLAHHKFPRDNYILREDAYIFHADKDQSLMVLPEPEPQAQRPVFLHSGDLGDIVASLWAVKSIGGGHYVVTDRKSGQRQAMSQSRYDGVKTLISAQQYVDSATYTLQPQNVTHDFTGFRMVPYVNGRNLAQWQAASLDINLVSGPWLTAPKDPCTEHKVVISRSARYRNQSFPWHKVLELVKHRAVFVGTEEEHKEFSCIPHYKTGDLMDVAAAINGSSLFIGNQSCPFWIAAGLGVPTVQETWPTRCDSIVKRDNAIYPQSAYDMTQMLLHIKKTIDY